jgi:phasin family protein
MTSIPEQFSEARRWQFETPFDFMRALTTQAFASAQQVLALNINTTRLTVERSSNTFKQLLTVTDPRDLFNLGAQTQEQFQAMLDYSRELMNIAAGGGLDQQRQTDERPASQSPQPPHDDVRTIPVLATGTVPAPARVKPVAGPAAAAVHSPLAPHPSAEEDETAPVARNGAARRRPAADPKPPRAARNRKK